jgi:YjbE family integral membrane protein
MEAFFNMEWLIALSSILLVNLLLSGDNALVIAMASRSLPADQRRSAVIWGSTGAVVCRIVLTLVTATLLAIPWLQCLGGVALLWISVNLLTKEQSEETYAAAGCLRDAIKVILFADLIMSLDNILALAAIAQAVPGSKYSLIIVGLLTSIPLVVCGAQLLMKLMDRFPAIVYAGAGLLAYAAAEMILGDTALGDFTSLYSAPYKIAFKLTLMTVALGTGYWLRRRNEPLLATDCLLVKENQNSL